jgi:2-methylcitrate dehydratase PrpD
MGPSGSRLPLRKKLADFVHDTSFEKLPQNLIRQTKLRLLDLIGVSIAGGCQNVASIVQRLISEIGGCGGVTLWGSDRKLPLLTAVLMNAVQGHAIDMDDGHR